MRSLSKKELEKDRIDFQLKKMTQQIPYSDKHQTSNNIEHKIHEICLKKRRAIAPRLFCRRWFGLEKLARNGKRLLTEEQILAIEAEYGYREKCINLIAEALLIKPDTVQRWGSGVKFNNIPEKQRKKYEVYLGYLDSLRAIVNSLSQTDEKLLHRIVRELNLEHD